MTRKRFIRLLMAKGCSRNEAHDYAWFVQGTGMPYVRAYATILVGLSYIEAAKSARIVGVKIADAFRTILDSFSETFPTAVKLLANDIKSVYGQSYTSAVELLQALHAEAEVTASDGDPEIIVDEQEPTGRSVTP